MKIKNLFFAAILFLLSSLSSNAATYTVTNTNNNGPGSLREAVATANSTLADDLIVFNIPDCPNGVCQIVLGSKQAGAGAIFVNSSVSAGALTISNPSGPTNLIISTDPLNRSGIFFANVGSNLTLEGLTMEDGGVITGGAIDNRGSLTVSNSIVQNNDAGAGGGISNSGSLTVSNSVIRNNWSFGGGGIYNSGALTVTKSEISGNFVIGAGPGFDIPAGGGILSRAGALVILDSTIASNSALVGGGIFLGDPYEAGSLTGVIASSTISGNTAHQCGAGIGTFLESSSSARITNATITMNAVQAGEGSGGAVCGSGGNIFARNNIIAGNTAANFPDIDERFLIFHNLGNNLIGGSPMLGPLTNNGGPTRTHALLAGSPAIDAGNNCVLTANGCGDDNPPLPLDQRGFGRLGSVDIGAFEFGSVAQQHLLSGRVMTASGRGVPRAVVTLDDGSGNLRFAMTNPFGYFRFADVPSGTYTASVLSKSYGFTPRTISVSSSITDLDFVALENP